jgi:ribosomal-protein-alanine N-acetyltransferase
MKPGKWNIRKMNSEDLNEVFSMESSCSLTPWSRNMFAEEMGNPFAHCFVMQTEEGSKELLIGFICFRNMMEESELLNICVHPDHRQLGVSKKMMKFYIEFCRRSGVKTFYLEVDSSNHSAIHLYQLFSYQTWGMRKKFYQGKFDALLMMKQV